MNSFEFCMHIWCIKEIFERSQCMQKAINLCKCALNYINNAAQIHWHNETTKAILSERFAAPRWIGAIANSNRFHLYASTNRKLRKFDGFTCWHDFKSTNTINLNILRNLTEISHAKIQFHNFESQNLFAFFASRTNSTEINASRFSV